MEHISIVKVVVTLVVFAMRPPSKLDYASEVAYICEADSLLEVSLTLIRVHVTHQLHRGVPPLSSRPFVCDPLILDEENGSLGGHVLVVPSDENVGERTAALGRVRLDRHNVSLLSRENCEEDFVPQSVHDFLERVRDQLAKAILEVLGLRILHVSTD